MKAVRFIALGLALAVVLVAAAAGSLAYAIYGDRSHPLGDNADRRRPRFDLRSRSRGNCVDAGIIGNVATFRVLARIRGEEAAVRAGEYRFGPHLTQSEVLRALVTGGAQVAAWVTIPEGFTAAQIAERLAGNRRRRGTGISARLHA